MANMEKNMVNMKINMAKMETNMEYIWKYEQRRRN